MIGNWSMDSSGSDSCAPTSSPGHTEVPRVVYLGRAVLYGRHRVLPVAEPHRNLPIDQASYLSRDVLTSGMKRYVSYKQEGTNVFVRTGSKSRHRPPN